ncbi:MAG: hypothetical protein JRC87_08990 [Deltaproteobacteria bacterium]|nr:hypothetical protein [Deltaproteobacteria bacterium]MBW2659703.1 hypothetical protein [Deltaproteobacteria bacterium]
MAALFKPGCLPVLIGSLPVKNHIEAVETILRHTPEVPLWPQLPKLPGEGMVRQFLSGFPGLRDEGGRYWIDTESDGFVEEMASFYEEYLKVIEDPTLLKDSRFGLKTDTAKGFYAFTDMLEGNNHPFITLKGQVTGPMTTGIGVMDQHKRSIFFDDNLRDMLIKLLALKGRWQAAELKRFTGDTPPIIFVDEPGIVSFGSSAFMGVSREMVSDAVTEMIASIHAGGGITGVHICANGDWAPVLGSNTDIISFDAYFYFDNFILFKDQLIDFLSRGGFLAWGIIPTGDPLIIEKVNSNELFSMWRDQLKLLSTFGFTEKQLMEQTFIAPSCGTGSLPHDLALKVLRMTGEVAKKAQNHLQKQ